MARYAYLDLPGSSGNYASTPDSAALDITGDIDIRAKINAAAYTGQSGNVVAKQTASNFSYRLELHTSGLIDIRWSEDGTNGKFAFSTAAITTVATGGQPVAIRATLDVDNGASGKTATFYYSFDDGDNWTQLGAAVTEAATTSIFSGTAPLEVGSSLGGTGGLWDGDIYWAEVRNGIGGSVVARFDPLDSSGAGDTSWVSAATGETWTVNTSGSPVAEVVANYKVLTSGTSWTVPGNWSNTNTIEAIGGGAGGTSNTGSLGGGGGGAYSKITNLTLTPAASITYAVGAAGTAGATPTAGGDTWFNGASLAASSVGAKGGGINSGATGGAGGAASAGIGDTKNDGGAAGDCGDISRGGGGGAGGPNGAGGAGGDGNGPTENSGGGGGGGNGGGSAGANGSGATGGDGGDNFGGSGGGTANGGNGSDGGGGAGGGSVSTQSGGDGGAGIEWWSVYGSGGGGGGMYHTGGGTAGDGGLYGGGGGSGATGGAGAQGVIVVQWGATNTGNFFLFFQ